MVAQDEQDVVMVDCGVLGDVDVSDDVVELAQDDVEAEQEPEEKPVPTVDMKLELLRALSIRSALGHTERLQLRVPGFGMLDDDRYYIVFNDASASCIDAYRDAYNQVKASDVMEIDDETGLPVGEQKIEQHNRLWPVMKVIIEFNLVREAALPMIKEDGSFGVYKWSATGMRNLKALDRGKLLTLMTLVYMAGDHVLGAEDEGMMSQLGE